MPPSRLCAPASMSAAFAASTSARRVRRSSAANPRAAATAASVRKEAAWRGGLRLVFDLLAHRPPFRPYDAALAAHFNTRN